jgi:hypothetical protein
MLRKMQQIFSTLVLVLTVFVVGCSDYTAKVGDKISGSGDASVDSNGFVRGSGFLTLNRSSGSSSITRDEDQHDRNRRAGRGDRDGNDDDDDRDEREGRGKKVKMNNAADRLVCTSSNGTVAVYKMGDRIDHGHHANKNCEVMTGTQATTAATSGATSGTAGGSGSSSTTTTAANNTGSGTNASTSNNPAQSY